MIIQLFIGFAGISFIHTKIFNKISITSSDNNFGMPNIENMESLA